MLVFLIREAHVAQRYFGSFGSFKSTYRRIMSAGHYRRQPKRRGEVGRLIEWHENIGKHPTCTPHGKARASSNISGGYVKDIQAKLFGESAINSYVSTSTINSNVSTQKSNDSVTNITLLGQSFVTRFEEAIINTAERNRKSVQETLNLKDDNIFLSFVGRGGTKIKDITSLAEEAVEYNPDVLLVDIAQNDLCWSDKSPEEYARYYVDEINKLPLILSTVELFVLCQVTVKTEPTNPKKKLFTDKTLQVLNDDIDKFNYHVYRMTRKQFRVVRWRHKGMKDPAKSVSTDGTHPNTDDGMWKYTRSINIMSRNAKVELQKRRAMSKTALKQSQEKNKAAKRKQRRRQRAWYGAQQVQEEQLMPKVKSVVVVKAR